MNWNEFAAPPKPVWTSMWARLEQIAHTKTREDWEFWSNEMDDLDRSYFAPQPAEPNARKTA